MYKDIRHHPTRRGARLVLHPVATIHPKFRRIFFGFYQRIFILSLNQEKVIPLVQRQEESKGVALRLYEEVQRREGNDNQMQRLDN